MHATVKATAASGITDVVTNADKYVQQRIKESIPTDWQFWGEEGEDNVSEFDESKQFMLVADPIEGMNNFRERLDDQWGSVVAVVDLGTKQPVVGIVAHPSAGVFYLGVKGAGAYKLTYNQGGSFVGWTMLDAAPEAGRDNFTYNNSPHFDERLTRQVANFMSGTRVEEAPGDASDLLKSRKTLYLPGPNGQEVRFEDPESGALEVVRYRGTIYFKTSNEMAATFVILQELGGVVTDGNGNSWTLGMNTLVAVRNGDDYKFLKGLYDKASRA